MNSNVPNHATSRTTDNLDGEIQQLDASTAIWAKYNEALESVYKSLPRNTDSNARSTAPDRNALSEGQNLFKLVARLEADLKEENNQAHERLETRAAWLIAAATKALLVHDAKLDEFESTSSLHVTEDSTVSDEEAARHTDHLLQALQQTQCKLIKTRLNNAYLEELTQDTAPELKHVNNSSTEELKAEISLLTSEIDAVTQMLVSHTHGDQIYTLNNEIQLIQTSLHLQREQVILDDLTTMTRQLETMVDEAESLQSSRLLQRELDGYLSLLITDRAVEESTPNSTMTKNTPTARKPEQTRPHLKLLKEKLSLSTTLPSSSSSPFLPSTAAAAAAAVAVANAAFDEYATTLTASSAQQHAYIDILALTSNCNSKHTSQNEQESNPASQLKTELESGSEAETQGYITALEKLEKGIGGIKARLDEMV